MTVRVVTDSAADIPQALVTQHAITVVPLSIRFGSESYQSGVELSTADFWEKLKTSTESPATAAPSAGDFQTAFEQLLSQGASGVVSVHLSSKLSATYQSAVVAAQEVGKDLVKVVDSLSVSAGTGLLALHASERADAGASAAEIADEMDGLRERLRVYFTIDTLEYLRRGGRIGGAQALLGTMLKFKPVMSLEDGIVEPVTRVRTRPKALEHLANLALKDKDATDRLIVISAEASDIDRFMSALGQSMSIDPSDVWELGPIVGAHGGPGVIGVAYLLKN